MKIRMLKIGVMVLAVAMAATTGMGYAAESSVDDITKEVLTGPNELNPEKILGPGGVVINPSKDIMMSFGATTRFIPTSESNWDFGLSEAVPGYIKTAPLKAFADGALDTAKAVENINTTSQSFNNSLGRGDKATIAAFSEFSDAVYRAADTPAIKGSATLNAGISDFAGKVTTLKNTANDSINGIAIPVASPVATSAANAAAAAAIQPNATLATITAAAYAAGKTTYTATLSAFTDAQQKAIATVSGEAAAKAAAAAAATSAGSTALYAFTEAMKAGSDQATAAKIAQEAARQAALTPANNAAALAASDAASAAVISSQATALVGGASGLAKSVAVNIMKNNPNATITEATAYTTALKASLDGFKPYYLASSFFRTHSNESGSVNDGYFRNETKLYFNAIPKDRKWSFYAALEFDRPLDTATVDNRGGKTDTSSNFGLERLNASVEIIPEYLRLHAGWDVWGVDIIEAGSMVYGDDNPGFWIKGKYKDQIAYSLAWLKLQDNDFQISAANHSGANDEDRDLLGGYVDYKFCPTSKVRFFYLYDRIREIPSTDLLGSLAAQAGLADYAGIYGNNGVLKARATSPDTNAHNVGAYYVGTLGKFGLMAEGVYKFGKAESTGLKGVYNGVNTIQYDDFDIQSYGFSGDISIELKDVVGWMSLKPHIGFMYTSGDNDSMDDKLSGYSGATNAQRFAEAFGGENTIIADTNFAYGSALYGYIPEFHGNGTPVFVGGLQNFAGNGNGRGDNPGMTMFSLGITARPKVFLIYRTNVNMFNWNEDVYVSNMVDTGAEAALAGGKKKAPTRIESGYVGTAWDNEVTVALSKHMFIKGQFSFFLPGEVMKNVTKALSGGTETDEMATRVAAELIWNF